MKEPGFFSECWKCQQYDVGNPAERKEMNKIRNEILMDIEFDLHNGVPGAEEEKRIYEEKCVSCLAQRIREFDERFLLGINANVNSLYAPKAKEE